MTTYYVCSSATGDDDGSDWENAFTDLQDGIDAAIAGDSVWVKWGVYTSPSGGFSIATNNVSIYGGFDTSLGGTDGVIADRVTKTVINGNNANRGILITLTSGGTGVLDGFAIINGAAADGAGISIYNNGE